MLIDWFTVLAQALNFLVLAWLLKRFLYRPVLDAIDARETAIAGRIAEAERTQAEAQSQRAAFEAKEAQLEGEREARLAQAARDADAERQRLLDAARAEAQAAAQRQEQQARAHARQAQQALARRVQEETLAAARQLLAQLADTSLEARLAQRFVQRLAALASADRQALRERLLAESEIRVRTARELPGEDADAVAGALGAIAGRTLRVRFEQAPELVCGIEASADGWKYAWNVADALGALQVLGHALLAGEPSPGEARPVEQAGVAGGS